MRDERGFVLILVLLVMAVVGVVGAEFAYSMRLEASAVRAYKEGIVATHLAEAAVAQAIRELVADAAHVAVDGTGLLTFYTGDRLPLPRLPREKVEFPGGRFSYRITDEGARVNVNTSAPDRIDRLLRELDLDKSVRDTIGDSLQDWRDANEDYRLNGAESDYYLALPVPYRSRNGNLESVAELLQIRGVTPEIYFGAPGKPGLADLVTVHAQGGINVNTATPEVLRALGLAVAQVDDVVQARAIAPLEASALGKFGVAGLIVATSTFRVEAEGLVDGRVAARVTAVIQKRPGTLPSVAILAWSWRR